MRTALLLCCLFVPARHALAATDVLVKFTLNTTDPYGAPLVQNRNYYIYRPDGLPKTVAVPVILLMDGSAPAIFHRKADQAGFVVVSCSFSGNSSGTPGTGWNNNNPRVNGPEDYDYLTEVISRVRASDNVGDVFTVGLSKGGHMSLTYACERPAMIKAAASLDEFMQLTENYPSAPVPILMFQGTFDTNVPYTMVKDTLDVWRAVDGLTNATPVTTVESSPLLPGQVSQATWRGGIGGAQVALVTIIGGSHTYPTPTVETGYDFTDGLWTFFSQFLSGSQGSPKIVSQPVNNVPVTGYPASFWVAATGSGPLSYQWQKNGVDIPGATANWYTTPPVTAADNGATYRATVRNDAGSVVSSAATLTVTGPHDAPGPAITTQPADESAVAGQAVTFTVAASSTASLKYQWQKNGIDISGATAASYSVPANLADSGASFTAVVTGGLFATLSGRATLTVTRAPRAPIILANPARARILQGQIASFSVRAWSQTPLSYQWQKGTLTGNMADIPGATGSTYTTPPTTLADHLTLFHCVVSNASGSATSASEILFVTAAPTPPTQVTSDIVVTTQLGKPFAYTIAFTGGTTPIAYSASPLPAGLSLDSESGEISGSPGEPGKTSIVIDAGNSAGHLSAILTLTVTKDPPPPSMDSWRLANFGASATDPMIAGDAADPDGDSYSNLEEFVSRSNPLNPASVPAAHAKPAPHQQGK